VISQDQIALTAVVDVCKYYVFVSLSFRRFRRLRTVVPLYDPPITCLLQCYVTSGKKDSMIEHFGRAC